MGRPIPMNTDAFTRIWTQPQPMPIRDSYSFDAGPLAPIFRKIPWGWQITFVVLGGIVGVAATYVGLRFLYQGPRGDQLNVAIGLLAGGLCLALWAVSVLVSTHLMRHVTSSPLGAQLQAFVPGLVGAATFALITLAILAVVAVVVIGLALIIGVLAAVTDRR